MYNGWTMNPRDLPNGTVLFLGISYWRDDQGQRQLPGRGPEVPKVYTYAALKQGNLWYFSGTGKVPQAAGWGAVERWLVRDNRKLEWVKIMSATEDVYPSPVPQIEGEVIVDDLPNDPGTEPENCPDHQDDPGAGECRADSCAGCGGYHCVWDKSCIDDPPWDETTPYDAD